MWTSQDNISNEMLKLSSPYIIQALAKLFNLILSSRDFPETWSEGLITPIYKKGDKFDPSTYRGICVGSSLAKLFCNIMNYCIVTFLTRCNIINKSQIGFLPKQRTSDHIYSLHTLINKNVKGKQRKILTCFVDLKQKLLTLFGMMVYYTNYYKSNQINFIVTSTQHMCLGEWNSWEHAPDSAETIYIYILTDLYRWQCAEYTYIYSVHTVYF